MTNTNTNANSNSNTNRDGDRDGDCINCGGLTTSSRSCEQDNWSESFCPECGHITLDEIVDMGRGPLSYPARLCACGSGLPWQFCSGDYCG